MYSEFIKQEWWQFKNLNSKYDYESVMVGN